LLRDRFKMTLLSVNLARISPFVVISKSYNFGIDLKRYRSIHGASCIQKIAL
jgi:hypothetical protein